MDQRVNYEYVWERYKKILLMKYPDKLIHIVSITVIIALLIGGVAVSREILFAAQMRNLIIQIRQFDMAVNNFQDKYGALPGDITRQEAEAAGLGDKGGNGDGRIMDANGSDRDFSGEITLFWQHLSSVIPENHYDGKTNIPGIGFPKSYLDRGGIHVFGNNEWPQNYYQLCGFKNHNDQKMVFADLMTPKEAHTVDLKIDDAIPNEGLVRAFKGTNSDESYVLGNKDSCLIKEDKILYHVAGDKYLCQLRIRFGI